MDFLLQLEDKSKGYDIDTMVLKDILDHQKYNNHYSSHSKKEFYDEYGRLLNKEQLPEHFQNAVPIGNIDFVTAWLNIFSNVKQQYPIEIPSCLRTDEFLKRKYSIVSKENIPESGNYFIKDVSQLKSFAYKGRLERILDDEIWEKPKSKFDPTLRLNPNHLYQVSEVMHILSEYRVYILNGKIISIAHYDGDPCLFPDVELINKANKIYSLEPDYPKSYTIDVMITNRGTSILECHTLLSTGLYSLILKDEFPYGYKDSLEYILEHNTPPTEFSNFNTFNYKKD